jgi:hypothetical protein
MKKPLTFLCLFVLSVSLFAQSNKEDVDIIQAALGKEKKALVASFVKLEASNSDAFWKLYDEYETSRKVLGKKRIALLEKYAAKYTTLDDATTDQMMKDTQSLQVDNDKLIVQYYAKIKKAAGVKPAAQFYQLEGYFLSLIRTKILEGIPLIGEFDGKP